MWIKPVDADATRTTPIFGFGDLAGDGVALRLQSTVPIVTTRYGVTCQGASGLPLNTWSFVAFKLFSSGSGGELSVGGVPSGSCGNTYEPPVAQPYAYVGAWADAGCFAGTIDELRVLDLTSTQVALDATGGPMRPVPGTVGLWHFDQGPPPNCCPAGTTC